MNFLLIGECYSSNLGDPLICENVKKIILSSYPNSSIEYLDLSGRIDWNKNFCINQNRYSISEKIFFKIIDKFTFIFKFSNLFKKYKIAELRYLQTVFILKNILNNKNIDLAIFAGGSLFMDYFIPLIYIIVKILSLKHIKIIFHACGISKMDSHDLKLLKKFLNNKYVKSISMRDSFEFVKQLVKNKSKISETYDTALNTPNLINMSTKKIATFGIGVYGDNLEYYEYQKKIIAKFMNSNQKWCIFTNGSVADYNIATKILIDLGISQNEIQKYLLKRPQNITELVHDITSFEKIISFRLHSLIIAVSYGIPIIGIQWDQKVKEFLTKINRSYACYSIDKEFNFKDDIFSLQNDKLDEILNQANISKNNLIEAIKYKGL